MVEEDLQQRTKSYALRVIRLVESLPTTRTADVIGRQLLRAGTARPTVTPYCLLQGVIDVRRSGSSVRTSASEHSWPQPAIPARSPALRFRTRYCRSSAASRPPWTSRPSLPQPWPLRPG